MAEQTTLRVELDGFHYNVVSNTGEARLQETADLVAERIRGVRQENPHYSSTRATMLVALQLAEELLNLQDEYLAVLEEAEIGEPIPAIKRETEPQQQTLPLEESVAETPTQEMPTQTSAPAPQNTAQQAPGKPPYQQNKQQQGKKQR